MSYPQPDCRTARSRSGLSQSQFAARIGVPLHTLQAWEQGARNPSGAARTLLALLAVQPRLIEKIADHR